MFGSIFLYNGCFYILAITDYFRSKFEDELDRFIGNQGLGVISDTDPQPIIVNSHLGRYAVVTVAKINNLRDIAAELLAELPTTSIRRNSWRS